MTLATLDDVQSPMLRTSAAHISRTCQFVPVLIGFPPPIVSGHQWAGMAGQALLSGRSCPRYVEMRSRSDTLDLIELALRAHPHDPHVAAVCGELLAWLRDGRPPTLSKSKPWLAAGTAGMSRSAWYRDRRRA